MYCTYGVRKLALESHTTSPPNHRTPDSGLSLAAWKLFPQRQKKKWLVRAGRRGMGRRGTQGGWGFGTGGSLAAVLRHQIAETGARTLF